MTYRVGWSESVGTIIVTDDDGRASRPKLPGHLQADLDAWQQHLSDNFTPKRDYGLAAGQWSSEEARWWFVDEARRIERELMRAIPRSRGVVEISAYPGVIPIGFHNDHGNWPLWSVGGGTDPDDFPVLSASLRDDLLEWSNRHETGDAETDGHRDLLSRLRSELGPLYEVE